MRSNKAHRLLALLLAFVMTFSLLPTVTWAADENRGTVDGDVIWSYDADTTTLTISGNGAMPDYNPVSILKEEWYQKAFTRVVIGEGVTTVGKYAFYQHATLAEIELGDSVKEIHDGAFYECKSELTKVTLPSGLQVLAMLAFQGDTFGTIELPDGLTKIGGNVFKSATGKVIVNKAKNDFLREYGLTDSDWPGSTNVTVEYTKEYVPQTSGSCGATDEDKVTWAYDAATETLTVSGTGAMADYTTLKYPCWRDADYPTIKHVVIGEGVTYIGNSAFYQMGIETVTIPETVTRIGNMAFSGDGTLTEIKLPSALEYIGNSAFYSCTGLTEITIPATVKTIDGGAFGSCTGLTEFVFPEGVEKITNSVLSRCTGLTKVTLPKTVTMIDAYAFNGCTALTELVLPDSVEEIVSYAFAGCTGFTELVIPASVASIGSYAFQNWTAEQTIRFALTKPEVNAYVTFDSRWKNSCNAVIAYRELKAEYCDGIVLTLKNDGKSYTGTLDLENGTISFADEMDIMMAPTFTAPEIVIAKADGSAWTNGTATLSSALTFTAKSTGVYTTDAKLILAPAEGTEGDTIPLAISFTITERAYTFQGTGTADDPYIVDSPLALYQMAKNTMVRNSSGKFYQQTKDIDMAGVPWTPIGGITISYGNVRIDTNNTFKGTYDGGNFKISNLVVDDLSANAQGLFGTVTGGTVKNVTMDSTCSIRAEAFSAAVVGMADGATIENCRSYATVYANVFRAESGGIVGSTSSSTIRGCTNYGSVTGNQNAGQYGGTTGARWVGGIAGSTNSDLIVDCHNYGDITSGYYVGGIVGSGTSSSSSSSKFIRIIGCSNSGTINSSGSVPTADTFDVAVAAVGGIAGGMSANGVIEGCYNTGTIIADSPGVGGLVGQDAGMTMANCYTTGTVTSTYTGDRDTAAGAAVGYAKGKTNNIKHNFYLAQSLNAIGKTNASCTGTIEAPVSKTAGELKSQEFLTELKDYFTQELTYTVWAADSENTNSGYPVITGVAEKKDYHKQLTAFKVGKLNMTIDEAAGTITGMIPYDVDLAAVTPTITISANATVSPASGEAVDFSKGAVTYTVTAEDGTTKTYQVTLTKPASGKGLMAFQIEGDYTGTTNEKKLLLTAADFKQDTLTYDIDCRDGVIDTQLKVWAIPAVQNATVKVSVNGDTAKRVTVSNDLVSNGKSVSCYKLLHQGKNTLVFTVTPPTSSDVEAATYTVNLNLRPGLHDVKVTATGVTVEPGGYIYETQSITEYTLTMTPTTQSVNVSFTAYGEPDSTIVTGPVEFTGTVKNANSKLYSYAADVPVDRTMDSFTIKVGCADETIPSTTYTFHLVWPGEYNAQIKANVAANVIITDANGVAQTPDENGVYRLSEGADYRYSVVAKGYVTKTGILSGSADLTDGVLNVTLEAVAPSQRTQYEAQWPNFRGNDQSMAIVSAKTPIGQNGDVEILWSSQTGKGYDTNAVSSPILVGGYMYAYAGTKIVKMNTDTGAIEASGSMVGTSSFGIVPPTYADGMIFVGLSNGRIQAFDATTLESLWLYTDPLGGQPNCPITYSDGCIYTGFWNSEEKDGNFVCIAVDDEAPDQPKEAKEAMWRYTSKGGFYWAGAYVNDQYAIVGTDDGSAEGDYTATANLLVFDKNTGKLVDSKTGYVGDIRSNIAYADGRVYFTTKGGYFYSEVIGSDGKIDAAQSKSIELGGMSTSTPVVYKSRAYVGVSGEKQFTPYNGHHIAVLDLTSWTVAYTATTQGYPQTSGLVTTGYGDGVYVYFMDNYTPGVMRVIHDTAGQTALEGGITENGHANCAPVLFTPQGALAEYCICSPVADEYGTLYFKNDTGSMIALTSAVKELKIVTMPAVTKGDDGDYTAKGGKIVAVLANGMERDVTKLVTYRDAADGSVEVVYTYGTAVEGYELTTKTVPLTQPEDAVKIGNGSAEGTTVDGVTTFKAGTSADAPEIKVTAPAAGWKLGESNTFTVASDNDVACVVLVKKADGSYEKLTAATGEDGTHSFTATLAADYEIIVMLNGDMNGDGLVNASDATLVSRACLSESHKAYKALSDQAACAIGTPNAAAALLINRACLSATHKAYKAMSW